MKQSNAVNVELGYRVGDNQYWFRDEATLAFALSDGFVEVVDQNARERFRRWNEVMSENDENLEASRENYRNALQEVPPHYRTFYTNRYRPGKVSVSLGDRVHLSQSSVSLVGLP